MPQSGVYAFRGQRPQLAPGVFLAAGAQVIGDVHLGADTSVWFNTVIRGDVNFIRVGSATNIQDLSVLHVSQGDGPLHIGSQVTIGHGAIIHACTIGDLCLIGMGATILDGAEIGQGSLVGANALVTQGKRFPPGHLIMGSPAKAIRPLTPSEQDAIAASAQAYVASARAYLPTSHS